MLGAAVAVCAMVGTSVAEAAEMIWPVPPSRVALDTPYGALTVKASDYVYESVLLLDGKAVTPKIEGIVNITYAFATQKSQIALVSVNSGSYRCPVTYHWITVDKNGYIVSPAFGSCSQKIKVFTVGSKFVMETPNAQHADEIDVYTYDGKSIRRRVKRS